MKFRNKILAGLVAVVMMLGVIGLPVMNLAKTFAQATTWSTQTLVVKNVNKSYDIAENSFLTFSDYCDNASAVAKVVRPDGKQAPTEVNGVYLTMPGLYALQFSLKETNDLYIYSDVIYIPVSTGNLNDIKLDGKLAENVKPGTRVEIPNAITSNGEIDTDVDVTVYTPYGETVTTTGEKIGQVEKWYFTNKDNVLGKYYVEYVKEVLIGKSNQTIYKYETIEFATDSNNTVSTEKLEEDKKETGEVAINITKTGLSGDDKNLYLYKYYDIGGAFVTNEDGSTNPTAEVYLTIYDTVTSKYYNLSTHKFDQVTSEAGKFKLDASTTEKFILRSDSFENLKQGESASLNGTGHKIKFHFTSPVDGGAPLEKTVELTEKFDTSKIVITSAELLKSEVTNMVKVDKVEEYDLSSIEFSGIKITSDPDYDVEGLKELIKKVEMQVTPENGSIVSSNNEKDSNGIGFDIQGADPLTQKFVYNYNKNFTETQQKWTIDYIVTVGEDAESDLIVTLTKSYTVYARLESQDKTSPSKLTIGNYTLVSTDGKFVIPNVTAEDKDDNSKATTGAEISVVVTGNGYSESPELGEELTGLADGDYTIKFTATDACGNTRSKFVGFKVQRGTATVAPTLTVNSANYSYNDGKVTVNVDTNADYVIIYGDEKGQFSPAEMKYSAGNLTQFEFDYNLDENACVAILAKSNSYGTSYVAVKISDWLAYGNIRSVGYGKLTSAYTLITPNTTVEAQVFTNLIWFGGQDLEIEAEEGALYTISDGNILKFYTAGTYTITSTEQVEVEGVMTAVKATTTLNIKNENTILSPSQPLGHKLVAEEGQEFNIVVPVVTNYHGYDVEVVVLDSSGKVVENALKIMGSEMKFVAQKRDEYTIQYRYSGENIKSSNFGVMVSSGNVATPKITVDASNENKIWEGETIKYNISGATALDKNGKAVVVNVKCFNQYGQELKITVEDGKYYVDIKGAGFYTVHYTAIDEEGLMNIVESVFAIEFPEEDDNNGLSAWAVVGIVFGSMVGACAIALIIIFAIKHNKSKKRFINKAKQEKKQERKEQIEKTSNYTIAESKDEKHWIVKNGNRTIGKATSKADAVEMAKSNHKKGEMTIKVYNKNGRLIDSI